MKIEETKNSGLEKHLHVKIPASDMSLKFQDKLSEAQGIARMPGYRPGKVPQWLITSKFGESIYEDLVQEVLKESVEKLFKDYNIFGEPKLENLQKDKDKDLAFALKFEIMPEIVLPDFKSITIERPVFKIRNEDIDQEIKILLSKSHTLEHKEGSIENSDYVVLDIINMNETQNPLSSTIEGVHYTLQGKEFSQRYNEEFEQNSPELYKHITKDHRFINKLQKSLIGKNINDTFDLLVQYPQDIEDESFRGKKIKYKIKVKEINFSTPQKLTDEFAKQLGHQSVKDLENYILTAKQEACQEQMYTILSMRLFNKLEEILNFDVPPSLFDKEFKSIFHKIQTIKSENDFWKDKNDEDLTTHAKKFAIRRARIGIALNEYAKQKNINIDNKDIEETVIREIRGLTLKQQQEAVNWYYSNPENMRLFSGAALERKVVKILLQEEIQSLDKPCNPKDLDKIIDQETENKLI